MFGGKRWYFTTCALFILCPRTATSNKRSNNVAIPIPKLLSQPIIHPRWTMNIISNRGANLKVQSVESGFDFNDEEMKKLKIWPGGAIPYYIDEFSFDKVFRDRLRNFLDVTNSATGLNFLELPRPPGDDESRWVLFVNRQGLLSCVDHPYKNFTNSGVQKVILAYDCLSNGGGLAEVVLALVGVPPQHNAPDRDKYVTIMKDNILPGKTSLFDILKDNEWLFHGVSYDFASAGHYSLHKYTKNGKATIKPLNALQVTTGEGNGFSDVDILKIKMMYNYISKNREKSVSIPECQKLFNRGKKFRNYVQETEDNVKPRKKPNKYLGLPEKSQSSNDKDNNNTEINTANEGSNPEASKEEDVEVDSNKEQDVEILNDEKEKNEKSVELVEKLKNVKLHATIESDYEDYEKKPQKMKFSKHGKAN